MTSASFDDQAKDYDSEFSNTLLGGVYRNMVRELVEATINFPVDKILELNGGTGEDALWLSQKCTHLLYTDGSPEMVKLGKKKILKHGKTNVDCKVLDLNGMETLADQKFDLVFSNFGGLNCLSGDELRLFYSKIKNNLSSRGKIVSVVMPTLCWSEIKHFGLRFNFKKAFRRYGAQPKKIRLGGREIKTYFHSPEYLKTISEDLKPIALAPIGISLPFPGLNHKYQSRTKEIEKRIIKERRQQKKTKLSGYADHFIIIHELK